LKIGKVDFAILEDRKFKTGPKGLVPPMGPRPDHISDPDYDYTSVDLPEGKILGDRQLRFLDEWGQNWQGVHLKVVLSQTILPMLPTGTESMTIYFSPTWIPTDGRNQHATGR